MPRLPQPPAPEGAGQAPAHPPAPILTHEVGSPETPRWHSTEVRLLPIRPFRAAFIAVLVAVSCVEIGAGIVVAEAWRSRRDNLVVSTEDLTRLDTLLDRLRELEGWFALAAVAMAMVWTFFAVWNVRRAARSTRSPLFHAAMWLTAPAVAIVLARFDDGTEIVHLAIGVLVLEMLVLYLPFGLLGSAAEQVGGLRAPFRRWYLSVVLVFVVHAVFTRPLDLADPTNADQLGRTALLYVANGLIAAIMTLMAGDATRSMLGATADKAYRHNHSHDDALSRFHLTVKQGGIERTPTR